MERFYSWRVTKQDNRLGPVEALIICYNACELSIDDICHDLEEKLKDQSTLPDCVYIIGNKLQCITFKDAFRKEDGHIDNIINRGMKRGYDFIKQYIFLEWDTINFKQHCLHEKSKTYEFEPENLLTHGVYTLLIKNNAIHKAPSGHSFKHPSGNKNKVFIQAREIASDEAELFAVSYIIALKHGKSLKEATKVYIDTMGIYAYVKCALDLCHSKAEILSYHSYEKLGNLNRPSTPYFCVISASTSGSMAKSISERPFEDKFITTIVDITSNDRSGNVIIPLDSMGMLFPDLSTNDGTLIEIIGENFTSKTKPPRPIVIGLPHKPPALSKIHKYLGFSVSPFYDSPPGTKSKLVHISTNTLSKESDFLDWLEEEINWSFPLTVSHIIYANDNESEELANTICKKLKEKLKHDDIKPISYKDLDKKVCKGATGIVVVSMVSRDGGVLREISRDLRSYVDSVIPRHFITPIGIPQTSESWKQLKSFLTKNPTPRSYGFSNWIQMPIGDDSEENFWTQLTELASKAQMAPNDADGSLNLVAQAIESAGNSLLQSPRNEDLKLSEGYLFFAKDSAIARNYLEVKQSMLYLTMSAVLQCAREHENHNIRLCPTGYESVVLGPECFLRFNDAVLQACLLRACRPSELDYSSSPEISNLMREFLTKIFIRSSQDFGDAALEFAATIALRKLRLTHKDMERLLSEALKNIESPSVLKGLLTLAKSNYP